MKCSSWITGTVDIDRDAEFTGDDVDQFSKLIDLGDNFEFITVILGSVITSSVLGPWIQMDGDIDTVPVIVHVLDDDATGSFAHATTAAVTQVAVTFRIGGAQWLRMRFGSNQAADETFYIRGFNRS